MSLRAFDIRKTRADATSIVRFRTEELVLVFLSLFDHWHWVFVLTRAAILKRSQQMFRQYEMQFALYYNCLIFTLFFFTVFYYNYFISNKTWLWQRIFFSIPSHVSWNELFKFLTVLHEQILSKQRDLLSRFFWTVYCW